MLIFYRLALSLVVAIILPSSLYGQADTLKFAWPDGATAKVHVRSQGRRVSTSKTNTWDMSLDFTMQLKRINDRILVSRNNFSGWKGALAPSFGGGAERFVDMVPTLIVTDGGVFVGIEGHDTARKLMNDSVAQSGGLDPIGRKAFETFLSNASLDAMARDHWSSLVPLWLEVELDPNVSYEFRNLTPVPQLGGSELAINGTVRFVKETPCNSTRNAQRCIHLHAETEADKEQVRKLLQSLLQRTDPRFPTITAFDRQFKVDIVLEKTTMLPHRLKITRTHNLTFTHKMPARDEIAADEYSTTYTFTWISAPKTGSSRAGGHPKG